MDIEDLERSRATTRLLKAKAQETILRAQKAAHRAKQLGIRSAQNKLTFEKGKLKRPYEAMQRHLEGTPQGCESF